MDYRMGDLAAPPRSVPLLVRLRTVLCGGFLSTFGWFFFGFGMIFVWGFVPQVDWEPLRGGTWIKAPQKGVITKLEETNFSEGGGKHSRGTPVWAYHFTFVDADGQPHEGVCYELGLKLKKGEKVAIEYVQGQPQRSRIPGYRSAPMEMFVLFVLLFPIIGLVFVLLGVRKGIKGVGLLVNGQQALGVFIDKQATNTRVNKQTVYKYTFEFKADDGQTYKATARTHDTKKFEDDEQEPLLYDPFDPSRAMLLDDLPGSPRISEQGEIIAGGMFGNLLAILLPLTVILGHGWYALRFFGN